MSHFPELQGKIALITGAGRRAGLGEGIARRLLAEGCTVVLTDLARQDELTDLAAELDAGSNGRCVAMPLDVLEEADVEATINATVTRFGALDILINNAGIGYLMKPLIEVEANQWDAVLGVNLRGAFLCIKYAARQMIAQGQGGRIINIASQRVLHLQTWSDRIDPGRRAGIGRTSNYRQCHLPQPCHYRAGRVAERILFRIAGKNRRTVSGRHAPTNPAGTARPCHRQRGNGSVFMLG